MTIDNYITSTESGENWRALLGDSCERLAEIGDNTVDLSVQSPPFDSLYVYSPTMRDLGNSASRSVFLAHYRFIIDHQLRVTKPGRIACVHVQQLTTTKATHGHVGLSDFRGDVIREFVDAGWIFHGEATIWKDPQALRHGQRVRTPSGWTPIEGLAVGDPVIGSDGEATKVVGVWPQGIGDIYRVTFSDGSAVDCDAAHRWQVRGLAGQRSNRWQVLTTADLMTKPTRMPSGGHRWEVPLVKPVIFEPQPDLPLHPYVLGALLGDGNVSQRSVVALGTQRSIAARVATLLPEGHTMRELPNSGKGDDYAAFNIGHPDWHRNNVLDILRDLGVQGGNAWNKRVPAAYLTAEPEQRLEILRGLLDTDGTVKENGAVVYGTTSEGLAWDVVDLVQGLGGIARVRCETAHRYRHKGEDRSGRPAWLVSISIGGEPLVTLPHKVQRWSTSRNARHRWISSIEPIGQDERTCITVAADDGLFVTEGYVVTHNSQSIRTKAYSLAFQTKNRDSSACRPALADYLLLFRKPGQNEIPIVNQATDGEVTNNDWIDWASPIWTDHHEGGWLTEDGNICPVWWGIRETKTLNTRPAKENGDEKHIAPLQLDFIERCVRLWSNPGELVLSPFMGIGSEGYVSLLHGRRFVGIELKGSYWSQAVKNLRSAEALVHTPSLFDEQSA